ncbi:MAG: hypothetical protein Q8907_06795 [Bacteroidota bacterium]|nr:hypothetical protein [Bacteroidota bacterium]MDP4273969.1 hypothetical protein [Bacteroidota bacterium]
MKLVYFTFSFLFMTMTVNAQNYENEMLKALDVMSKANDIQSYLTANNSFIRIGSVNKNEWLPNYYSAYLYAKMSYLQKDDKSKDKYLSLAENEYKEASSKKEIDMNEMCILNAYILQAEFSVDYMSRSNLLKQSLSQLETALKKDPNNPRANMLLGISYYNMPSFVGGDKKKAEAYLEKADSCYSTFKPKIKISPNWGKDINTEWLKIVKK